MISIIDHDIQIRSGAELGGGGGRWPGILRRRSEKPSGRQRRRGEPWSCSTSTNRSKSDRLQIYPSRAGGTATTPQQIRSPDTGQPGHEPGPNLIKKFNARVQLVPSRANFQELQKSEIKKFICQQKILISWATDVNEGVESRSRWQRTPRFCRNVMDLRRNFENSWNNRGT